MGGVQEEFALTRGLTWLFPDAFRTCCATPYIKRKVSYTAPNIFDGSRPVTQRTVLLVGAVKQNGSRDVIIKW